MISNSAKFDLEGNFFIQEIQQLGLSKETSEVIVNDYNENKDKLRSKYAEDSYRVSKLLSVDWRVDQIISSSDNDNKNNNEIDLTPIVNVKLTIDTKPHYNGNINNSNDKYKNIAFEIGEDKLNVLLYELTQAKKILENVN